MGLIYIKQSEQREDAVDDVQSGRYKRAYVVKWRPDPGEKDARASRLTPPRIFASTQVQELKALTIPVDPGIALCVERAAHFQGTISSAGLDQVWRLVLTYQTPKRVHYGWAGASKNTKRVDEYQRHDVDGLAICNSACDPFSAQVARPGAHAVYRVKLNLQPAAANAVEIRNYIPVAVGSNTWGDNPANRWDDCLFWTNFGPAWGRKQYSLLFCDSQSKAVPLFDNLPEWAWADPLKRYWYYEIEVAFEYNPQLWIPTKILDKGRQYYLNQTDKDKKPPKKSAFATGNKVLHGGEQLLDGKGFKLDDSNPFTLKAKYREFKFYYATDFMWLFGEHIKELGV